jgi:hypothetical protein
LFPRFTALVGIRPREHKINANVLAWLLKNLISSESPTLFALCAWGIAL